MGAHELRFEPGAWFGTQVGSTLWIALAAVALAPAEPLAALAVLACFAAANGLGWAMWRKRAQLEPRRAYRALILAVGVFSLLALAVAQASGGWSRLEVGGRLAPGLAYAFVIAVTTTLWLVLGRRR